MQYGPEFFYTVAYGPVRAQEQSGGYQFIWGGKLQNFEMLSKFWAFMSCTILLPVFKHPCENKHPMNIGTHNTV